MKQHRGKEQAWLETWSSGPHGKWRARYRDEAGTRRCSPCRRLPTCSASPSRPCATGATKATSPQLPHGPQRPLLPHRCVRLARRLDRRRHPDRAVTVTDQARAAGRLGLRQATRGRREHVMANLQRRPNGQWRARYRDASGRQHARHFARKVDGQRWLNEVTAAVVTGQYVDPKAGRVTFRDYAEHWRTTQVHRPSSAAHVETMLRRHAYPTFGERSLSSILPSEVQAWVKRLGVDDASAKRKALAPATVGTLHSIVSSIFKAALRDRRIMPNPCEGTKLPQVERAQVVPPTTAQVEALRQAMPEELRALVTFTAGTGMRQGEVLGLT